MNVNHHELHSHERRILSFVEHYWVKRGLSPSLSEICEAVGLSSKDHVYRDLNKLEAKGFIERERGKARTIRLVRRRDGELFSADRFQIPLVGAIAAGRPIPAPGGGIVDEDYEMITLTRDIVKDSRDIYALRVKGSSMIDALINDGDIVILRHQERAENGEMVAVWLKSEGETTLKRFYYEGDRVRLQPENRDMSPIYVHPRNVRIQGKVIAVLRQVA